MNYSKKHNKLIKSGMWFEDEDGEYYCTCCKNAAYLLEDRETLLLSDYCPCCGAKMIKESDLPTAEEFEAQFDKVAYRCIDKMVKIRKLHQIRNHRQKQIKS